MREEVALRLEGRRQHHVDGEQREHGHDEKENVPTAVRERYASAPARRWIRKKVTMSSRVTAKSDTAAAAAISGDWY